jgi:hypothetical protein
MERRDRRANMTNEHSASDSTSPSLHRLLRRWAEEQIYVICRVTKEVEAHIDEPSDEKWRERVSEGQNRLLEELDQLAQKLIDSEPDGEAGRSLAALWAHDRHRMRIEDSLRHRITEEERAFDKKLCESWVRAEESLMDKALASSERALEEKRRKEAKDRPAKPADS